jgi:hypothetical protein
MKLKVNHLSFASFAWVRCAPNPRTDGIDVKHDPCIRWEHAKQVTKVAILVLRQYQFPTMTCGVFCRLLMARVQSYVSKRCLKLARVTDLFPPKY